MIVNIASIVVCIIIGILAVIAGYNVRKSSREGCSGNCMGCGLANKCTRFTDNKEMSKNDII